METLPDPGALSEKEGRLLLAALVKAYVQRKTNELEQEEARELPEKQAAVLEAELMRRLGPGGELVSAQWRSWEEDGLSYLTLSAECRERLGQTVPLTEAELSAIYAKLPDTED